MNKAKKKALANKDYRRDGLTNSERMVKQRAIREYKRLQLEISKEEAEKLTS